MKPEASTHTRRRVTVTQELQTTPVTTVSTPNEIVLNILKIILTIRKRTGNKFVYSLERL